jgi:hypothetical protein
MNGGGSERFLKRPRGIVQLAVQRTEILTVRLQSQRTGLDPFDGIDGGNHLKNREFGSRMDWLEAASPAPLACHNTGARQQIENLREIVEGYFRVCGEFVRGTSIASALGKGNHCPERILSGLRKHTQFSIAYIRIKLSKYLILFGDPIGAINDQVVD